MSNNYFPDDADAEQQQRLVDPDDDDDLHDDRTPVRISVPISSAVTVVDKTRTAR